MSKQQGPQTKRCRAAGPGGCPLLCVASLVGGTQSAQPSPLGDEGASTAGLLVLPRALQEVRRVGSWVLPL